jgi:hypothetical protein
VSHEQRHRGKHPDDDRLFSPEPLAKIRVAAEEVGWLLSRGYPRAAVIDLVGGHHQLESRQRLALDRAVCSDAQYRRHVARELDPEDVARKPLRIDGFNLIITLEVALSGGALFVGTDGAVRDIAGMRGSYHTVEETDGALERVGAAIAKLRPSKTLWYLDEPVSNSGRLRAKILDHAARWKAPAEVELVPSADPILAKATRVVTSDSAILDECDSWFNLTGWIVKSIPNAWIITLP